MLYIVCGEDARRIAIERWKKGEKVMKGDTAYWIQSNEELDKSYPQCKKSKLKSIVGNPWVPDL